MTHLILSILISLAALALVGMGMWREVKQHSMGNYRQTHEEWLEYQMDRLKDGLGGLEATDQRILLTAFLKRLNGYTSKSVTVNGTSTRI